MKTFWFIGSYHEISEESGGKERMRLPNMKMLKLFKTFNIYIVPPTEENLNGPLNGPLFKKDAKDVLVKDAPPEAVKAFEEWKVLAIEQDKEDAKWGYAFT